MLLTLGIYSQMSNLSIDTNIMHIGLIAVELFLILFGYVCKGALGLNRLK